MNSSIFDKDILLHPHDHKKRLDWKRILKFLDDNLEYSKINTFLDRGAGLGDLGFHILKRNNQCEVICEDINSDYLEIASQRHPKIKGFLHDINQGLSFKNNSFDLVSCIGTLHYGSIQVPENVLREIIRVSKKYILLDFFSKYSPWIFILKIRYPDYNPRRYSSFQIQKLLQEYNLKILAKVGTRIPFPKLFPFLGRTTVFLLEKQIKEIDE